MNDGSRPGGERRKRRRFSPPEKGVRVWLVSGEFEEMYTTVNFAKRLLNISMGGACIETTGRLRPDVKMSVEVRFDTLSGTLRSPARIVWVETTTDKGVETHRAGLWFQGQFDATKPVREYLEGGDAALIVAQRKAEYRDLKQKADTRKEGPPSKKWGAGAKIAVALLVLILCYVGSFWGLVFRGRISSAPNAALTYRYLGAGSTDAGTEDLLAKFYSPLYWGFKKAGIDLTYGAP